MTILAKDQSWSYKQNQSDHNQSWSNLEDLAFEAYPLKHMTFMNQHQPLHSNFVSNR